MKRRILIIFILILCGCYREVTKPSEIYLRSYVMSYYDVDGIVLTAYKESARITVNNLVDGWIGGYTDEGEKKEAYDALCEKHGDMTFCRTVLKMPGEYVAYPGVDYVSIEITSDADFDDRHPAGSSLADIATFISSSVKPYIDNGYVYPIYGDPGSAVKKLVSDLIPEDLVLTGEDRVTAYRPIPAVVGYFGALEFRQKPTLSKTHTFTVTLTADDGRVFSDTVEMTFE